MCTCIASGATTRIFSLHLSTTIFEALPSPFHFTIISVILMSSNIHRRGNSNRNVNNLRNSRPPPFPVAAKQPSYRQINIGTDFESDFKTSKGCECNYLQEALCTAVWAILACLLRGAMLLVHSMAHLKGSSNMTGIRFILEVLSGVASVLISFLPEKIESGDAAGFVFAGPTLLFAVHDYCRIIPNLPVRISEMVMGRLTPRDLAILVPIHFLASVAGVLILRALFPGVIASHALEPIVYSEDRSWAFDFVRETLVTAGFTVGILVLPEILKVNSMSKKLFCPILLLPLYLYSVDGGDMGSAFSPDLIYALRCVSRYEELPLRQSSHLFGPMLGGFLGGCIMATYFPDDSSRV